MEEISQQNKIITSYDNMSKRRKLLLVSILFLLIGIFLLTFILFILQCEEFGCIGIAGFYFFISIPLGIIFMLLSAIFLNKYFKLSAKNPNIDIIKKESIITPIILIIISIIGIIWLKNYFSVALLIIGIILLINTYFKNKRHKLSN